MLFNTTSKFPRTIIVDAGASYSFKSGLLRGLSARIGVDNLLDEQPPILPTWQQANTEPSLYDVLGQQDITCGCNTRSN